MKLTIKSGESIDHALQYLRDYLEKYKEDYPMLKGNMNVYVTLEGFGHKACPDNEREMILTDEQPVDVEASQALAKQNEVKAGWKAYLKTQHKERRNIEADVDLDLRYLETAEAKGRKPEAIEKRKAMLQEHKEELAAAEERVRLLNRLDKCVEAGEIEWFMEKRKASGSAYNYKLVGHMIFKDAANGADWHFTGYESRFGSAYGSLHKGLPYGYQT